MFRHPGLSNAFVAGCLVVALISVDSQAQPAGSYQQTCRNSRVEDGTLYSSCRDTRGRYHDTSLAQVSRCVGGVFNENGALRCSYGANPDGSYLRSCDQVRVDNEVLFAECTKIGGGNRYSSLADYQHCWSDIGNVHGFLACDQGDRPAPEGTFRATCRDRMMNGTVLKSLCLNNSRDFKASSLNTANCRQPIENRNGQLSCGARPPLTRPLPPPQGFSAVEVFNCQSNRRPLVIWKASGTNPNWARQSALASNYSGNACPSGSGLQVGLDAGINWIRAVDPTRCGQDNPTLDNCQVNQTEVVGHAQGSVLPLTVGF